MDELFVEANVENSLIIDPQISKLHVYTSNASQ